ncbi:hypothetical protein CEE36_06710 [candidate division TA06 bacterium B3_TA06]|uniref:Thioredoxin domain-containing protein n=1 Tax=candidate division TA06 bacterium B3_TA06 TaxID=2012487 RepID=A0A532V6E8_UNCT6|nr:MAG: hypothetical protein CEE36_06710 [candidate division TA06 bacterium B3_TA06]
MKLARLSGVMVILSILGAGFLAGCGNKNPSETPEVTERIPDTSSASEVADTSLEGDEGNTPQTSTAPKEDPGADRRQAPDFTLADLRGNQHSLSDFYGKVVLLDFWATWCGPCRREIPHLIKLYETYKPQGFVVLGVGLDKEANLSRFASEAGISYIVLADEKGVAGKLYGIRSIPRTLIIDKKGRIAFDHTGFVPGMEAEMEAQIRTLLAEEY